jgi:hypothetical protein
MPAKLRPTASHNKKQIAARLPRNLEKNLLAYAAAASGALIGLAQPAAAEIIYTPSNIPIAQGFAGGAITQFDINNDGVADFAFSNFSYFTHGLGAAYLKISPDQTANEIVGVLINGQNQVTAAGLAAGVQVGSNANFQSSPKGLDMAGIFLGSTGQNDLGSWLTVETAYLGLKFVVNGEVHYGWARIKLVSPGAFSSASIYGYAYESVPNQAIITGQTSGTAGKNKQVGQANPASTSGLDRRVQTLGLLAAGSPATAVWRGRSTAYCSR